LILYLHNDIWFVMVQIKIFPVIAIQLTPLQNQAVQVDPRLLIWALFNTRPQSTHQLRNG
jgi:hypothetical protein